MKGRRPRPLDDGDSGEVRVSGHLSWAKPIKNKRVFCPAQSATITLMSIISNCTVSAIEDAATSLLNGNLVAFPTETVYGLGADAINEKAVARIYDVKGRPSDHPLIVHISSINNLDKWAKNIPEYAIKLARSFWPGPMTLILPRTDLAKDFITGGQENVGIRVPAHSVALSLLKEFEAQGGYGVAAPSANRFGAVSPTSASAVELEIGNFLNLNDQILDGGKCEIGIESTIIDCTKKTPVILRPGAITNQMISAKIINLNHISSNCDSEKQIKSSGSFKSHYSPRAKIYVKGVPSPGDGYIALAKFLTPKGVIRLASPQTNTEYAHILYHALRQADLKGIANIYIVPPNGNGISVAINDRIKKAAAQEKDII